MTKKRRDPTERTKQILKSAMDLSEEYGYTCITRQQVADHAGISDGLVGKYFGTMEKLRFWVMKTAIKEENLTIIAQGLLFHDPVAENVSQELREQAAKSILG